MKAAPAPELVDVRIESLDAAGDGLARHHGRPIAVPFTIPGERVRVQLRPPRAGITIADVVEILSPSPHRIDARCPHFGPPRPRRGSEPTSTPGWIPRSRPADAPRSGPAEGGCGGCSWQHIAYPEQLRLKTQLVDRLVRQAVPRAPAARSAIAGTDPRDPWGYRHKVHFVFSGALTMGHYARGSRHVIPVRECPVHDERGNAVAFRLRDAYTRARIAAADATSAARGSTSNGVLRSVAIRVACNTPELAVTLVVTSESDKRLRAATRTALRDAAEPNALHVNLHPRGDAFIFGRDTRRIAGSERIREEVAGTSFLISPTAFFQTNVGAAEILVELVVEAISLRAGGAHADVLDLYAGAGLFALPLAQRGHRVTAVEENRAAVADGEASQRLNRIASSRCRFVARPVEAALRAAARADAVVLDPPREGCSSAVIDGVFGDIRPRTAVYVSCNPEALARDLHEIPRYGYAIASVQPVDMFPHTAHVETVVVLTRK